METSAASKARSGSAAKARSGQTCPLPRYEEVGGGGGKAAMKNCEGRSGEPRKGKGKRWCGSEEVW
jgi:hypothetical protein